MSKFVLDTLIDDVEIVDKFLSNSNDIEYVLKSKFDEILQPIRDVAMAMAGVDFRHGGGDKLMSAIEETLRRADGKNGI